MTYSLRVVGVRLWPWIAMVWIMAPKTVVAQPDPGELSDQLFRTQTYNTVQMSEATEAKFRREYHSVRGSLESGKWDVALKRANRLVGDLRDSISDSSRGLAARTLVLRAIAHAALGNGRDALWDYDVALAFVPEVEQAELPTYPPATAELRNLISGREPCRAAPDVRRATSIPGLDHESAGPPVVSAERPELKSGDAIRHPRGMKSLHIRGVVILEYCIDRQGIPTQPQVLKSMPMPFMITAFEALASWHYEPVIVDGRPVPVVYARPLASNIAGWRESSEQTPPGSLVNDRQ